MRHRFYIASLILLFSSLAGAQCQQGTKLILEFDQKNQTFSATDSTPAEICHWIKNQLSSNVQIQYFNNGNLVFEHSLVFPLITIHEDINKKTKLRPHARKDFFQKIVNIPVERKLLQTFKVVDLETNEMLSSGTIE